MNIAFIGLGRMGWHIAAHLMRAGHSLSVYDTSSNLPADWVKAFGGRAGLSVAETVAGAECVMTSLPADAALQSVWDLAQPTLAPGAIWVDHSTTSAEIAKRLAKTAKDQGRHFIDAPVSGGTVGAEKGTLAIMAGADESAWSVVEPLMSAYAQRASLIGPAGAGQLTKMSNQICVAGIGQALAEGLAFAEHHGLDPRKVLDVMLKGSSTSWMMENRAQTMIDGKFDFGFSTTLMRKDLGLVMEEAHRADVSLPVTALVAQLLSDVSAMGLANADWCSLMQRQRRAQSGD